LILGASSLAALSFLGFDGISTLSEDARDPQRDIWRATLLVCFIAGGLFILQSYLGQMVWPDFRSFSPIETAFLDIGRRIGGQMLFYVFSFVLVVGGIASAITGQASASRLLVGMGRDSLLPRRLFAYVHPRLGTPVYSVLLMGGVHLAGALLLRYTEAAELVNFGALFGFMAVNAAVSRYFFFTLRGSNYWLNLFVPGLGLVVCFGLWINLSHFALGVGAGWMLFGLLYLLLLTRGFTRPLAQLRLE
jgi:amino acid transporter